MWEIGVHSSVAQGEVMLYRQVHRFEGSSVPTAVSFIGDLTTEFTAFPSLVSPTKLGDPAIFRARLLEADQTAIAGTAEQTMIWDDSYAWTMPSSATSGGFTATDRENLTIVKSAVWVDQGTSPTSSLPLIGQVIDLVRGPPRSLLRPTASQLLEGRGVVPASPDINGFAAWGATWSFFTVPAGFGFLDGQVRHYINRMAQFVVVREGSDNTGYIDEVVDIDFEGGFLLWKHPPPTEIRYDIAPGVQLLWRWLG